MCMLRRVVQVLTDVDDCTTSLSLLEVGCLILRMETRL
jgi:hypothetical protein